MFCALNGATRSPRRRRWRHNAAVTQLFPGALFTEPALLVTAFVLGLASQGIKICVDTLVQMHVEDAYRGRHLDAAPDVIVGYGHGYRASWDTTTGRIPAALIVDNDHEWSGDHCMDSRLVPGVMLANRPFRTAAADLRDLPVTILDYFGIKPPGQMTGRPVL